MIECNCLINIKAYLRAIFLDDVSRTCFHPKISRLISEGRENPEKCWQTRTAVTIESVSVLISINTISSKYTTKNIFCSHGSALSVSVELFDQRFSGIRMECGETANALSYLRPADWR